MIRSSLLIAGLLLAVSGVLAADAAPGGAGFSFQDKPGEYLDMLENGKTVTRYMYAHDTSSPARRAETYKPYMHVFDVEAGVPITKGPGGEYTHHRGIFIGWMKIGFDGNTYDRWHMKGGDIVHQKLTGQEADKDHATFTSLTKWMAEGDRAIIEEERTTTVRRGPGGCLLIDFVSKLNAPNGDVKLDGDPEHAGVQFRPANEVDRKETTYLFPREQANPHKDLDYPWVGETYILAGKKYSVVDMNHPGNPKNTVFSAYRNYGRFGAFFKSQIKSGESLTLRYRFLVGGEMFPVDVIQKCWDEFAGVKEPSPLPKTTTMKAEQPKPAATKPAKGPSPKVSQ